MNTKIYEEIGISKEVIEFGEKILTELKPRFEKIDETAEYNQLKVIKAMQDCKVSEACLLGTTGYGYNDMGRDNLERVYASVFHTEDALVRPQITCGTHALALALMSNLRPGDMLLSPAGKPYDTLEEVIGIRPSKGSLAEYGIQYKQVDLLSDGTFDYENIKKAIEEAKTSLDKPTLIQVKTTIGKYSLLEGTNKVHGSPLTDEDITRISSITHGYVGADLASLCREAGLKAIKRMIKLTEDYSSKGVNNMDRKY